jgi:hypothetical protein
MQISFRIIFFIILAVLGGCATTPPPVNVKSFKNSDLAELSARYNKKELGKIEIFTSKNFNDYSSIGVLKRDLKKLHYNLDVDVGNLSDNQGFVLYLIENSYILKLSGGTTKSQNFEFDIKAGETVTYRWDKVGERPLKVGSMPSGINILSAGSLYSSSHIDYRVYELEREKKPKFEIRYEELPDYFVNLYIVSEERSTINSLVINGIDKSDLLKSGGNIKALEKLALGNNSIEVKLRNINGYESVKWVNINVLSNDQKRQLFEKAEQEKRAIEKEILAKKAAEERLIREGDGSADDLLCKKYGFKPQTNGYAECRMKIDFAKTESKRQQEQYEREQREYQRQLAEIEREKERRRGAAFLELGARMMGGQSPINALGSLGTGAPIAPSRPVPINQTITLPGGRMINCTTMGSMTNCF